jgi:hypothetical protein
MTAIVLGLAMWLALVVARRLDRIERKLGVTPIPVEPCAARFLPDCEARLAFWRMRERIKAGWPKLQPEGDGP